MFSSEELKKCNSLLYGKTVENNFGRINNFEKKSANDGKESALVFILSIKKWSTFLLKFKEKRGGTLCI